MPPDMKSITRNWRELMTMFEGDRLSSGIFFVCVASAVIGLVILVLIIVLIASQQSIDPLNVDLEKSAQFGDYVGGLVGTIWALSAVLLIFLALRVQNQELKLHLKEFKLLRSEFAIQSRNIEQSRIENNVHRHGETLRELTVMLRFFDGSSELRGAAARSKMTSFLSYKDRSSPEFTDAFGTILLSDSAWQEQLYAFARAFESSAYEILQFAKRRKSCDGPNCYVDVINLCDFMTARLEVTKNMSLWKAFGRACSENFPSELDFDVMRGYSAEGAVEESARSAKILVDHIDQFNRIQGFVQDFGRLLDSCGASEPAGSPRSIRRAHGLLD